MRELYYEALSESEPVLTPSLFSSHVYAQGSAFGRIWRVIYAIIGFFFGDGLKNERLKTVLGRVVQSYAAFEKEIEPVFLRYQSLIGERTEGYTDNEELYKNLRYQIHQWNDKTMPFVKLALKKRTEKIFKKYFQEDPSNAKEGIGNPFIFPHSKAITMYQPLIDLEEHMDENYPYAPLGKLAMGKPLSKTEEQEVGDWIENAEGCGLKQRKLQRSLEAFILNLEAMNTARAARAPSLVTLEMELLKRGMKSILREDPKHIEWRKALKKGDTVLINETPYTLGEEVRHLKPGFNQNLVFLCRERGDAVVVIGKNLTTLAIRRKAQEELSSGFLSPEWFEISRDGRAGLQERMLKHISQIEWKSSRGINPKDKPFIRPFIGLIRFMKQIGKSPKNIPYEHLYFSGDCTLKSVKPTQLTEFDYGSLEKFAFEASKGNPVIFKTIVENSTLFQHRQRLYFEDIIRSFEREEGLDPQSIASLTTHSITLPSVIDRGKDLLKKAESLLKKIEKKIHDNYEVEDAERLKSTIRTHIRILYESERSRSFFFPNFKGRVMNQIQDDLRLEHRQSTSF